MAVLLLVGLGWLAVALLAGLLIGGSIRMAEADHRARAVPRAPATPGVPPGRSTSRVLVGALPSPRSSLDTARH